MFIMFCCCSKETSDVRSNSGGAMSVVCVGGGCSWPTGGGVFIGAGGGGVCGSQNTWGCTHVVYMFGVVTSQ